MKLEHTFKVHKVEPRDDPGTGPREERVVLHPIDAYEANVAHRPTALHRSGEAHSGHGKIQLTITEADAIGKFKVGQLITVTFAAKV